MGSRDLCFIFNWEQRQCWNESIDFCVCQAACSSTSRQGVPPLVGGGCGVGLQDKNLFGTTDNKRYFLKFSVARTVWRQYWIHADDPGPNPDKICSHFVSRSKVNQTFLLQVIAWPRCSSSVHEACVCFAMSHPEVQSYSVAAHLGPDASRLMIPIGFPASARPTLSFSLETKAGSQFAHLQLADSPKLGPHDVCLEFLCFLGGREGCPLLPKQKQRQVAKLVCHHSQWPLGYFSCWRGSRVADPKIQDNPF